MTLMGTFTQWEWMAVRDKEQQFEARQSRFARALRLAIQAGKLEEKSRRSTQMLKRLVYALGCMWE